MKKEIAILLTIVFCFCITASAFADSEDFSFPQSIFTITKYITSNAGISIKVVLSIHEESGEIVGLQNATIQYPLPSGISYPSITGYVYMPDYILFNLTYKDNATGVYMADSAYVYKNISY